MNRNRGGPQKAAGAGAAASRPVPVPPSTPDLFDAPAYVGEPADAASPALPTPPARRPPAPPGPPRPPGPAPALAARAAAAPIARRLWLALRCTDLPLVAAADAAGPVAVVDATHPRRVVVACDAVAARRGVRPGLALNAAHALAPGLEVRDRAPDLEERRLQALARRGVGYTPFVSLEPPDALLLEVRGSLRLFGGAEALVARAVAEFEGCGHAIAHALAPTPRAALWLADGAPGARVESPAVLAGALARLPVAVAHWPERTLEQLARLGVRTLGELRRLPRDGLARRLGAGVLAELDEAFGLVPAPRRRHVVPERFQERVELTAELESLEHLWPAVDRLVERMARFLRVRDAGVARLALTFVHRGGARSRVTLGRATPGGEAAEWRALLRERLGRVALPAPAVALGLRTSVALPLDGRTAALPGLAAEQAEANAATLLDRLRARLGDAAVNGVRLVAEHRPERAWRRVPAPATAARAGAAAEPPRPLAPRPLWLLGEPERLRVQQGQPCCDGLLRFEAGPERIESGWWDGRDVVRDYYVATTRGGVRLWIYRAPHGDGVHWFLHGVFG